MLAEFAHQTPEDEPVLERELRIETLNRLADLDPVFATQYTPDPSEFIALEFLDPPPPRSEFPVARVLRDLG